MLVEGKIGPVVGADQTINELRQSRTSAIVTTDAHARCYEGIARGNVYYLFGTALAPTAYTGPAGTPLLSVYNGSSNKNLVFLAASIGIRTPATVAGQTDFCLWTVPSATATTSNIVMPTSALTQTKGGSSANGFVNTAIQAGTGFFGTVASYYWATAASSFASPSWIDLGGILVIPPLGQMAFGATIVLTSATYDVSLFWEEVPA